MTRYLCLAPIVLLACTGQVLNAGSTHSTAAGIQSDGSATPEGSDASAPPVACSEPGGEGIPATTPSLCQSLLVGRWRFCGGTTSSMPTVKFWNDSDGIEFANDNGTLDFHVLREAAGGGLAASPSPAERGTATFDYVSDGGLYGPDASEMTGGACVYTMNLAGSAGQFLPWEMFWFKSGLLLVEDNVNGIQYRFVPAQ